MNVRILDTADVAESATLGAGTVIWHLAQVREGATLGERCIVGRGAYVGTDVVVGDDVKIQNYALVYEPSTLGSGCFIGPAAVLTNDRNPRSVDVAGARKEAGDWQAEGVEVGRGASIGARAVIVGGVTVGDWAMVAAGAVVTRDVAPFALVAGVPAKAIGWVGRAGHRLREQDRGRYVCPHTATEYRLVDGHLEESAS